MHDVMVPQKMLENTDDLPAQIDFVIVYSCALENCDIRKAMDIMKESGDAHIIDVSLSSEEDEEEVMGHGA